MVWMAAVLLISGCASNESTTTSKQRQRDDDSFTFSDGHQDRNNTLEQMYGPFPKETDPKGPILDRKPEGSSISVVGSVNHQAHLTLQPGEKILLSRAVWRARGYTRWASKHLSVVRRSRNATTVTRVNMKEILEDPAHKGDLELQPDDLVVVKQIMIR